jgi:hypothetical protein
MIYMHVPSFMKINADVQAILMFYVSNLNDCNVGITGGKELRSAPLIWPQAA